jgi:hypothetical protein
VLLLSLGWVTLDHLNSKGCHSGTRTGTGAIKLLLNAAANNDLNAACRVLPELAQADENDLAEIRAKLEPFAGQRLIFSEVDRMGSMVRYEVRTDAGSYVATFDTVSTAKSLGRRKHTVSFGHFPPRYFDTPLSTTEPPDSRSSAPRS